VTPAARSKAPARPGAVSPARVCAFSVLRRVFEQAAYADRAFTAEAAALEPRDRALAMALAYGTVQRRATLDYVASRLSSRPPATLDPPVLAALRLGLFQLLFLDGVAEHAAVNESVELAKGRTRGGEGLVNAVLRRAGSEGRGILAELGEDGPDAAAILHSVPPWLAGLWWSELGPDRARALLRSVNQPAESSLRVNTLIARREEVLAGLPVAAHPAAELPEGIILEQPFDAHGSPLWGRGAIMPQSRGSMLVARVLDPRPGERVLDLCAAPGAKTTHLGALMQGEGRLVAVERHPGRADALARTIARMHVGCAEVRLGDATIVQGEDSYDRVLVDPPCSGLGTLQSRPDLRWRTSPERIAELARLQGTVLEAAATVLAPGGVLVYSVCTISRAEGDLVIERFLDRHREFRAEDLSGARGDGRVGPHLQLSPDRDGTDGFFIARLRRG
jgi:16S rRNA (cytosine967-C5)-methyltransferase